MIVVVRIVQWFPFILRGIQILTNEIHFGSTAWTPIRFTFGATKNDQSIVWTGCKNRTFIKPYSTIELEVHLVNFKLKCLDLRLVSLLFHQYCHCKYSNWIHCRMQHLRQSFHRIDRDPSQIQEIQFVQDHIYQVGKVDRYSWTSRNSRLLLLHCIGRWSSCTLKMINSRCQLLCLTCRCHKSFQRSRQWYKVQKNDQDDQLNRPDWIQSLSNQLYQRHWRNQRYYCN